MNSQNNNRRMNNLIRKWAKATKIFQKLGNMNGKWVFEKPLELKL